MMLANSPVCSAWNLTTSWVEIAAFALPPKETTLEADEVLTEALRRIVRQVAMEEIGKKPEVTVVISRLALD